MDITQIAANLDLIDALAAYYADPTEDTVRPDRACPTCRENRMDWLVWNEDEMVACQTCGCHYVP